MNNKVGSHNDIQYAIDAQFSGVTKKPELRGNVLRQVRGEVKVKKKLSLGLALTITLLLLAGVALAITISDAFFKQAETLQSEKGDLNAWSLEEKISLISTMEESSINIPADKYSALLQDNLPDEEANRLANEILIETKVAREALKKKYDFSNGTFTYFTTTISFAKGDESVSSMWIVKYVPKKYNERIGIYEVCVSASTGLVQNIEWSLADTEKASIQLNDWSADVWRPQLIDRLATFQQEYEQKRTEMELQLGDYLYWSIKDKAALDEMYLDTQYPLGDQVINIIPGVDDISEENAIRFATDCIAGKYVIDPISLNQFAIRKSFLKMPAHQDSLWIIEFWRYTDAGDENYAVEFRSPTKLVELCQLYHNGVAQPLKTEEAAIEGSKTSATSFVSKDQASKIAWIEMKSKYGFEENVFTYFDICAEEADNPPVWEISFISNNYNPAKVGTYHVTIDRVSGSVLSVTWDLEEEYNNQGPSEPWRSAELWSAYEYNQYAKLRQAAKAIIGKAGDRYSLSFEQQAEYDLLYRQAGYDRTEYYHGLPGEFDISLNEALQIAKDSICEKYKIARDLIDQSTITYEFDVSDEALYMWRIHIMVPDGKEEMYSVEIDSRSREVLNLTSKPGTNG